MAPPKDVLLVGFGAVGAIYSLILKRSNLARVTAVARSNYDAVNNHGVHFKSAKYGEISGWRPDRLVRSVAEAADRPYSYVFLTTKAIPERSPTTRILHPLISSPYADEHTQPVYVLLQNGLNVEVELYNALKQLGKGEYKIVSTALWIGTNLLEPNVVEHANFDRVTLGIYRYKDFTTEINTPEEASVLEDIGNILKAGGSDVTIVPEVQRCKFAKNFWNVGFSSFSTLTQQRLPALWRLPPSDPASPYTPYVSPTTADLITKYTLPNIKAILQELVVLGRALGYPDSENGLPSTLPDAVMEGARKLHVVPDSFHKPSMLLDAEKGQPIEVEVIFGEVVRMAQERGVEMPRVEMLYALLLVVQNQILAKLEEGHRLDQA
ncbi:ketopantoate reductase PanE/ApbA-domain-containing protein [Lyophyllum atratum]|nr:ketopantoate reductase PanE/ApbA-domain-containing protein [Lyophyllum atratum]